LDPLVPFIARGRYIRVKDDVAHRPFSSSQIVEAGARVCPVAALKVVT
jgi:hypothetical protein